MGLLRHDDGELLALIWRASLQAGLGGRTVPRDAWARIVARHARLTPRSVRLLIQNGKELGYWDAPDARMIAPVALGMSGGPVLRVFTDQERKVLNERRQVDSLRT